MEDQTPESLEACSAGYRAQQIPGAVLVFAKGLHATGGYQVFLELAPGDVYPPEYVLWHVKPSGMVLPAQTPFAVHTTFAARDKVDVVVIQDSCGRHEVQVECVPEVMLRTVSAGGDIPIPY